MRFQKKFLSLLVLPIAVQAASILERAPCERAAVADAVALVELVLHHGTLVNGQIQTKFVFTTVEPLKGDFPHYFEVYAPGGVYHDVGLADSRLPELTEGSQYVVFLEADARLGFHDGVASAVAPGSIDLAALRACTADTSGADLSA